MPDLRLYRLTWIVSLIVAFLSLLTLRTPQLPALGDQPVGFDGERAMKSLQTLALDYPGRTAGSNRNDAAGKWLGEQATALGLRVQVDTFSAVIDGERTELHNVWALAGGESQGAIVVLANRDSPPRATQGADDNASGMAAALELARVFSSTRHDRPIIFLWTDGDSYGGLGARDFVGRHPEIPIVTTLCLRRVAADRAATVRMNGWSAAPEVAPPWLWILGRAAARSDGRLRAPLPTIANQLLRLAIPVGGGSQGPFVGKGIPALTLSAAAPVSAPPADTVDGVSVETLTSIGKTAERMVISVDADANPTERSGSAVFFSKYRQLSGGAVKWGLVVLLAPQVALVVDLWSRARRRRVRLLPAWKRLGVRLLPWFATLAVVYAANFLAQLPSSPGGVIPPEAAVSHQPHYIRVLLLLLLLVLAYHYGMAIERRLARRDAAGPEAVIAVAHITLLGVSTLIVAINPFTLIVILPAALAWPLARPGNWVRSLLPVWCALLPAGLAILFLALRLHLDLDVWWYFFLLLGNRTIPVSAVALGAAYVAAAAMLARELHNPLVPAKEGAAGAAGGTVTAGAGGGAVTTPPAAPAVTGRRRQTNAGGPPEGGPPASRHARRIRRRRRSQ